MDETATEPRIRRVSPDRLPERTAAPGVYVVKACLTDSATRSEQMSSRGYLRGKVQTAIRPRKARAPPYFGPDSDEHLVNRAPGRSHAHSLHEPSLTPGLIIAGRSSQPGCVLRVERRCSGPALRTRRTMGMGMGMVGLAVLAVNPSATALTPKTMRGLQAPS